MVGHSSGDPRTQVVPVGDRVQAGIRGDVAVEGGNRVSLDWRQAQGDVGQRGMAGTLGDHGEDQMDLGKDHGDHMDQAASFYLVLKINYTQYNIPSYDVPLRDCIHGAIVAPGDAGTSPGDHRDPHGTRAVVDKEPNLVAVVQTD